MIVKKNYSVLYVPGVNERAMKKASSLGSDVIIFDLEVAFLFPWAISLGGIGMLGFWSMVIFLGVLTVGFIYEWRKGALEWE